MGRFAATVVAAGLIAALVAGCRDGGGKKGGKDPTCGPRILGCSEMGSGTLEGTGATTPDFKVSRAVGFHHIEPIPSEATAVTIRLVSSSGDGNLHLALPGSMPGTRSSYEYCFASEQAPPTAEDWIRLSLTGLESPTDATPTRTLQEYQDVGGRIPFAVWGVLPDTAYEVEVICESTVDMVCGTTITGTLPGSGQIPPDLSAGTEVRFFHLSTLPVAPGTVSILSRGIAGDVSLYLGRPGLDRASQDMADYIFSSTAPAATSTDDLIILDASGLHDVFGATNPTVNLQDYVLGGAGIRFVLAGVEGSNDYSLRVSCSDVEPAGCGEIRTGSVNGSGLGTPDLGNPLETRFFQLDPIPSTAQSVTISLNNLTGDADLRLAAPGAPIGSTDPADYIFASARRVTAGPDSITIDSTGLQDAMGGTDPGTTIADYMSAGTPVGLAVTGYASQTSYSLSPSCVAPPLVLSLDCGSIFAGGVTGSRLTPPNLSSLSSNLWFEIPSLPPGVSQIDIRLTSITGDANLLLAGPDVPPGSQDRFDYVAMSGLASGEDYILVCSSGTSTGSGSTDTTPTTGDYLGASENLSFVVAGYELQSSFEVTVRCLTVPAQDTWRTLGCGDRVTDTVEGSYQDNPPDFTNPQEVHFFEVNPLTAGAGAITLDLLYASGEDADLWLARPGAPPGSTCPSDYILTTGYSWDEYLVLSSCGVSTPWTDYSWPQLADYEAVGSLCFAVAGYTQSTRYTLDVTCGSPNPVRATDCGGTATDTVTGGGSFANPSDAHIYEVPLASVQASSSIRIEIDVGFDDADIFLADPGVTPGSICDSDYDFYSYSGSNPDWIEIDTSGLSAADGSSTSSITIADYQAAGANLSFVILGYSSSTSYDMTVTCN